MAGNVLNPKGRELPRLPTLPGRDESDPLREFEVTVPELERLVKRSTGRSFFIRACWSATVINQNGVAPGNTRVWEISGNVNVPKREALKFLSYAYTERARNAVWARVTISNNCFFIGG